MRLIIDTLAALMLLAILGGVTVHSRQTDSMTLKRDQARVELDRFQYRINVQSALNGADSRKKGYPRSVEPSWFEGKLPDNPLLGPAHPWVEVAAEHQADLMHPERIVAARSEDARFWYNPAFGIVRARVPDGATDQETLELYNAVNSADLTSVYRQP